MENIEQINMSEETEKKENLMNKARERTVRTQTIEYDLETLVKKLNKGYIKIDPEYQRKHRWDIETSSRLIESLILNIPIPLIYISQDISADDDLADDDIPRYSVIDGQQRLTAIQGFFENDYSLDGLQVLEELNGLKYKDLPGFLVRRLEERMIRCLRIDSTIDSQVKYDIFERLNSGSVKLEAQELRNAVASGPFNSLIKELAKNKDFIILARLHPRKDYKTKKLEPSARVKKMEDEELVLRYFAIAYKNNFKDYKGKMRQYLTESMHNFNNLNENELSEMRENFNYIMGQIHTKFGSLAFAKYKQGSSVETLKVKSQFNAAIYDVVCSLFNEFDNKITSQDYLKFKELFKKENFFNATEGSVTDVQKLKNRIEIALEAFSL